LAPPPSRGEIGEFDGEDDVEETESEGVALDTPKTFDKICCLWPSIRSSMKSDCTPGGGPELEVVVEVEVEVVDPLTGRGGNRAGFG